MKPHFVKINGGWRCGEGRDQSKWVWLGYGSTPLDAYLKMVINMLQGVMCV